MAREALLKFGPMKFTQMTLEHDQKYVHLQCVVFNIPPGERPLGVLNYLSCSVVTFSLVVSTNVS